MKLFITGESGVISTELSAFADFFGHTVVNTQLQETEIDELKTFQAFKVRKKEIDFTDSNVLRKVFEITKPELVIHSGAYVGTDYCDHKKDKAILTNVYGTKLIVDLCNEKKIPIIYFSTTAIFNPAKYSRTNPITEKTEISPQTLYGITKYAGELIVKNECKTDKMIIRPVFGFGDYPNDLHSALTKLIYTLFSGQKNELKILLNPNIGKNYYRVVNIAYCVFNLIKNNCWGEEVNVGEHYSVRKNWYELIEIISKKGPEVVENFQVSLENVKFLANNDYLHWHNIENKKLTMLIGDDIHLETLEEGIEKTIISVVENAKQIPYWI